MSFYTYILISEVRNVTYTGHTDNFERRLAEHNRGKSRFTSKYKPWKLLHLEVFEEEHGSIRREKYLKSAAGRRWIKKNLFNN